MWLAGSRNVPIGQIDKLIDGVVQECTQEPGSSNAAGEGEGASAATGRPVVVLCRRGNDSQLVVQKLHERGVAHAKDLIDGLFGWSQLVDPTFPEY